MLLNIYSMSSVAGVEARVGGGTHRTAKQFRPIN